MPSLCLILPHLRSSAERHDRSRIMAGPEPIGRGLGSSPLGQRALVAVRSRTSPMAACMRTRRRSTTRRSTSCCATGA